MHIAKSGISANLLSITKLTDNHCAVLLKGNMNMLGKTFGLYLKQNKLFYSSRDLHRHHVNRHHVFCPSSSL